MTPMLSIFTLAIEFDRLFLAIFQSFRVFLSFIFDQLALPLNICFKICFKSLFESIPEYKTVSKVQKRGIFLIQHFGRHASGGAIAPPPPPPPPPPLATLLVQPQTAVDIRLYKKSKSILH